MLYPSIDELIKKSHSNYALAMATAKRARMLVQGDTPAIEVSESDPSNLKEVSIAVEEFYEDKFSIIPASQKKTLHRD